MELKENEKRLLNIVLETTRESRINELNELSKNTGVDLLKVIGNVDEIDRINFEYYPSGAVKEITVHPCASFLTYRAEFDEDENMIGLNELHEDGEQEQFKKTIEVKKVDEHGDGARRTIRVIPREDGGRMIFIAVHIMENYEDCPIAFYVECYKIDKDGKLVEKSIPIWA